MIFTYFLLIYILNLSIAQLEIIIVNFVADFHGTNECSPIQYISSRSEKNYNLRNNWQQASSLRNKTNNFCKTNRPSGRIEIWQLFFKNSLDAGYWIFLFQIFSDGRKDLNLIIGHAIIWLGYAHLSVECFWIRVYIFSIHPVYYLEYKLCIPDTIIQ